MKIVRSIVRFCFRDRETNWLFSVLAALLYTAYLAWGHAHHEGWRDEIHAWATAKHAEGFWDIVTGDRVYDGHPPLWYWYLRVVSFFTKRWWGMDVAIVVAMGLASVLFLRYARFPRVLKLLLLASYLLGYEYGVLSRNYSLTWLFLVVFGCLFNPLQPRFVWLSVCLGLLANTSAFGTLMAGALCLILVPLGVRAYFSDTEPRAVTFAIRPRLLVGLAILLATFTFTVLSTLPPEPNPYSPAWNFAAVNKSSLRVGIDWFVYAFLPVRRPDDFLYWLNVTTYWSEHPELLKWTGVALLVSIAVASAANKTTLVASIVGLSSMCLFQIVRYGAGMRHLGNFFLFFVAICWLGRTLAPRRKHLLATLLLVVVGLFQFRSLIVSAALERKLVFSAGRPMAALIEQAGLQDLPIVAGPDAFVLTVTGYLGRPFLSAETGDVAQSMVFHSRRASFSHSALLDRATVIARTKRTPVLLISNSPLPQPAGVRLTLVGHARADEIGEETYWSYKLEL